MSELDAYLRLHFAFAKAKQLADIKAYFGSLELAVQQNLATWQQAKLITENQLGKLFDEQIAAKVEQALNWQQASETQTLLTLEDEAYPSQLTEIADPPILLYVRGDQDWLQRPQLAVVGSRSASKVGIEIAEDFAEFLSSQGITITSGLASGIDAAAHRGGLKGIGKTIAVVGTGLDRLYPASNKALGQQIVEQGAMVSEYELGTGPKPYHFPQRNRIISGMATGVLVVEAALKSGSLITARTALEQGREVFAVPGSIHNPKAKGCHQLIKQGAKLVESGEDILEELAPWLSLPRVKQQEQEAKSAANQPVSGLLRFIEYEPICLDELAVISKMPVSEIQAQLVMLELEGKIVALSAGRWQRV